MAICFCMMSYDARRVSFPKAFETAMTLAASNLLKWSVAVPGFTPFCQFSRNQQTKPQQFIQPTELTRWQEQQLTLYLSPSTIHRQSSRNASLPPSGHSLNLLGGK